DIMIGAAAGSFVRLAIVKPKAIREWIITGFAGYLVGVYLTKPMMNWLKLQDNDIALYAGAISFILGAVGLILVEKVMVTIRTGEIKVFGLKLISLKEEGGGK
ncbi:MAG: hypothetical protein ACRDBG_04035, partial [Waterburya sp.]